MSTELPAWSNGDPRPFILVHHVKTTRKQAIENFVKAWARGDDEPVMKSWRRAYREGARCIRVSVHAWGQSDEAEHG